MQNCLDKAIEDFPACEQVTELNEFVELTTLSVRPGRITNRCPSSLSVDPLPSMTIKIAGTRTDKWGMINDSPGLHVTGITSNSGTWGVVF
jgi:hypothetical protein